MIYRNLVDFENVMRDMGGTLIVNYEKNLQATLSLYRGFIEEAQATGKPRDIIDCETLKVFLRIYPDASLESWPVD